MRGFGIETSTGKEISFGCFDGTEAISSVVSDSFSNSYDEMIREKENIPKKLMIDAATSVINVACPEVGIPVSLLVSVVSDDKKGQISYAGKLMNNAIDSKVYRSMLNCGVTVAKDAVDFYKIDDNLVNDRCEMEDIASCLLGGSKTGYGIQVVEYSNMYELLRIDYLGVNECYQLNIPEENLWTVRGNVKTDCTGGKNNDKQEFNDEEICNAILLIMYGEDGAKNKVILNPDNSEEKMAWSENCNYHSLFDIPLELRIYCLCRIQKLQQYDDNGNYSLDEKNIIDEFNAAVGNH
ncbi:hypothetical protein SAMN02910370_02874 [Lachnospiraceae bacterium XPB1003]|nr:hypothetical protein SAMN02910370_02874 [Lachnospiraceae bacterium XPB1003]